MAILVCRVAWMPRYQSDSEPAVGGGRWVDEGGLPHESLNFLPVGETYYGVVENRGEGLGLNRLGGPPERTRSMVSSYCFLITLESKWHLV